MKDDFPPTALDSAHPASCASRFLGAALTVSTSLLVLGMAANFPSLVASGIFANIVLIPFAWAE